MKTKAIVSQRSGVNEKVSNPLVDKAKLRRLALTTLLELPQGILTEVDESQVAAIEKAGFRVHFLPDLHLLRLGNYQIDVSSSKNSTALPQGYAVSKTDLPRWTHYLIHFVAPPTLSWFKDIEALGIRIIETLGNYSAFVVCTAQQAERLKQLTTIAWFGPFQPAYRTDDQLLKLKGILNYVSIGVLGTTGVAEVRKLLATAKARIVHEAPANALRGENYHTFRVSIDAKHVPSLAQQPDVRWVVYDADPVVDDERTAQITTESLDAVAAPNTQPVTGYNARLAALGLSGGTGVTIAICDSGVDTNDVNPGNPTLHADIRGRLAFFADQTAGANTTDTNGHGTHVAGIIAGNATLGDVDPQGFLLGIGLAPAAQIGSINAIADSPAVTVVTDWMRIASANGAQVMNNSWGSTSINVTYDNRCRQVDGGVRDADGNTAGNQPLHIIFSAGNSGNTGMSNLTNPHVAKNIVCVGNSLTARPNEGFPTDDIRGINASSSRGPALDGRVFPTVVAPGTDVISTRSSASANPTYTDTGATNHASYTNKTGSSMSAPNVSGLSALFIEWWRNRTGGLTPSPAVVKAALVNGAIDLNGGENWKRTNRSTTENAAWSLESGTIYKRQLPFTPTRVAYKGALLAPQANLAAVSAAGRWFFDAVALTLYVWLSDSLNPATGNSSVDVLHATPIAAIPNNDQGWGRVSLENMLLQTTDRGPKIFFDRNSADVVFTANGQSYIREIVVVDRNKPLRITMAYSDAPGAANANPALVNNLNLEVEEILPDNSTGQLYLGNVFGAGGFSTTGGAADARNNLECVYIQNPIGRYRVRILATTITTNAQPPYDVIMPWQDFTYVIDNAIRTVDNPVCVVPVVDRSGSMVTYGYVDTTRVTTKNFIDLLSVNDSTGLVSFGTTGVTNYSNGANLSTILGNTEKDAAKLAVDNLVFSGCTNMGQGLTLGRDLVNTGPTTQEKALVLLSDGFDNGGCNAANPTALSIVNAAGWPAQIPVYTCAMGASADTATLQQIAEKTKGRFYSIPVIEDLGEIYNYIRGQVAEEDESIITNESAFASYATVKSFVEKGAKRVTFSVNWFTDSLKFTPNAPKGTKEISVRLIDPKGRKIHAQSTLVSRTVGKGYVILRIEEPAAGAWTIEVETNLKTHTRFTVGGFVKSSIRLYIPTLSQLFKAGSSCNLPFQLLHNGNPFATSGSGVQLTIPSGNTADLLKRYQAELKKIDPGKLDKDASVDFRKLQLLDQQVRLKDPNGIFISGTTRLPVLSYTSLKEKVNGGTLADLLKAGGQKLPLLKEGPVSNASILLSNRGNYQAGINITGMLPDGSTKFVRKDLLTIAAM